MNIISTLVLSGLFAAGQVSSPSARSAELTATEIARQIERLGAEKLVDRDDASRRLWHAGPSVEPALRKAAESPDAEVRFRARAILERFQFGVFPDTPEETISLIKRFRGGNPQVRQEVLKVLGERQQFDTLLALLRSETDEDQRRAWFQVFLQEPTGIISQMVLAGKWDEIERLLETARATPDGLLLWASYLTARGQLESRIARLSEQSRQGDATANRPLAYLLRAHGDLPGALAAAERAADKPLQRALAVERGDWSLAARLQDQGITDLPVPLPNARGLSGANRQIELLGYAAAFHRLAGNAAEFRTQVAAIEKLAEDNPKNPTLVWYCTEALLINDQPDQAMVLLRAANPVALFDLLAYQHRYAEAFELAQWKPGRELNDAWFDSLPAVAVNAGLGRQNRFRLAAYLARVIHNLGQKDDAQRLITFLAGIATQTEPAKHQTSSDAMWILLGYTEIRLGLSAAGYEHAGRVIERNNQFHYLRNLFGSRSNEAEAWFRYLRGKDPKSSVGALLQQVERSLAWSRDVTADTKDLEATAAAIAQDLQNSDEATQNIVRVGIATTCLARKRPDLARQVLEPIVEKLPLAKLKLADALLDQRQWELASKAYVEAWRADRQQLTALWLSGHCAIQAGQRETGETYQRQADVLALTGPVRHALATGIAARGLTREALPHWERLQRTGAFEHHDINDGARILADTIQSSDKQRAAKLWERHMLADLRVYFYFLEYESYLRFPLLVHKFHAHAAVEAGDFDRARREIRLAWKMSPNDVRLAEHLVPAFERAKRPDDANAIFQLTYEYFERTIRDYPRSAEHHNNLAWLSARCHRRLDEALGMARKAVELAPREANYLDTLAEVLFHQGHREEAVKQSQRCTELAPREATFRRQLERFQNEPLPTGPSQPLNEDVALLD